MLIICLRAYYALAVNKTKNVADVPYIYVKERCDYGRHGIGDKTIAIALA